MSTMPGLARPRPAPYRWGMAISMPAPDTPPDPASRIEAAMGRIEAALAARTQAGEALTRRHAALKARMAEAVAALDDVIARGSTG